MDLHAPAHDLAQPPGALGDVGGGDEGGLPVQGAGQLQGAEQVVHGHLNLHHRQAQVPPEHGGGVAAGDDHVVVPVEIGPGDLQAQLPVAHEQGQVHLGVSLRQVAHQGLHPLIGGDAQDTDLRFHEALQMRLNFEHIIPNAQKSCKPFSTCFKNKRFEGGKRLRTWKDLYRMTSKERGCNVFFE